MSSDVCGSIKTFPNVFVLLTLLFVFCGTAIIKYNECVYRKVSEDFAWYVHSARDLLDQTTIPTHTEHGTTKEGASILVTGHAEPRHP